MNLFYSGSVWAPPAPAASFLLFIYSSATLIFAAIPLQRSCFCKVILGQDVAVGKMSCEQVQAGCVLVILSLFWGALWNLKIP